MALTRKNLMVDGERVAELAARRGISESAAVREAVDAALFVEAFGAAMEALRATGYGTDNGDADDEPPPSGALPPDGHPADAR